MGKSITLSIIFQAESLNYGEGFANFSELKKLSRMNGNYYSIATRQSLGYDIRRLGKEMFNWDLDTIRRIDGKSGTLQFKPEFTIKESVEMDLFGYMKTKSSTKNSKNTDEAAGTGKENGEIAKTSTRSAVARVSNAISLEPYRGDTDFLNNKGFADRVGENPNIANIENHYSYYTYTVTIDLDKVGEDNNISLSNEEKAKRVNELLDIIKVLNRHIRGRFESLAPLFVIGGMYPIANPFFLGRLKLDTQHNNFILNLNSIKDVLETTIFDCSIKNNTAVGINSSTFYNEEQIKSELPNVSIVEEFFRNLKNEVNSYYKVL